MTLCGGDCQADSGNPNICVEASRDAEPDIRVSCGDGRMANECIDCPFDSETRRDNITRCSGDCEIKNSTTGAQFCGDVTRRDPVTAPPPLGDRLEEVVVSIWSSGRRRPDAIRVHAKICVGDNCCKTDTRETRGGLLKFSRAFQNFGNCSELKKRGNENVHLQVLKSGSITPLRVFDVVASFGEYLYIATTYSGIIGWGVFSRTTESEAAEAPISFPPTQCPGDEKSVINTCPKEHVRVLKQLPAARKFCIYQGCDAFSADLSIINIGQLGSGGFCVERKGLFPQHKYCCDLDQYFTDYNWTTGFFVDKENSQIAFPRCHESIMIYERTDDIDK